MNNKRFTMLVAVLCFSFFQAQAAICPDPNNSSLQWGVIPPPWELNPFSENRPWGEENTRFVRATILVVAFGRGVVCTYQNSAGIYSIWWLVNVKVPARTDNEWRDDRAGFECNSSLEACVFYPA